MSDTEFTSKSARKRDAERLQKLGQRLTVLRPDQIEALTLPDELLAAILDHQRFGSREAKRRQLQFIGRLMRTVDHEAIASRLDELEGHSALAKHRFHQAEHWRQALLEDPAALTGFLDQYPDVDRQQLRQLIKRVHAARDQVQRKKNARTLFRFIHEITG